MSTYEVIVGNIGRTLTTESAKEAKQEYLDYVRMSKLGVGRASGEVVTLMRDSEPYREYRPKELPESPTHHRTLWWRGVETSYEVVKSFSIRVDFTYVRGSADGEWLWEAYYGAKGEHITLNLFDGNPCADPYLVLSGPVRKEVIRTAEHLLKEIMQSPHLFVLRTPHGQT